MDRKEAILRIKDHMEHHGIGKYPHLKLKEALYGYCSPVPAERAVDAGAAAGDERAAALDAASGAAGKRGRMTEHILSLSYGKDSMACLGAIEKLGWQLERIVTADVWATDTIPADLPPMVEFKAKADKIIKERYGIQVEHVRAKRTYEQCFYSICTGKSKCAGKNYGWPMQRGPWCNSWLKQSVLQKIGKSGVQYIGIAADEPNRFHNLTEIKKSPLVEAGWTEQMCRQWCEKNDLLSPIYTTATRGGCWFCHNQGVGQLRLLRRNYPELWALMLKWDDDSPVIFKADGHTVHDYEERFRLEDEGLILGNQPFRWSVLYETQLTAEWYITHGGDRNDQR